jgi:hypothetical protein
MTLSFQIRSWRNWMPAGWSVPDASTCRRGEHVAAVLPHRRQPEFSMSVVSV